MSLMTLQLTQFKVQKLQCIGGEGRAAPYRITTYEGMDLGSLGEVMEAEQEAMNAASYERIKTGLMPQGLKRLLGIFGF